MRNSNRKALVAAVQTGLDADDDACSLAWTCLEDELSSIDPADWTERERYIQANIWAAVAAFNGAP